MSGRVDVSVVVPVLNEEASLSALVDEVREALDGVHDWELVVVDDGSTDGTARRAEALARSEPRLRLLRLARTYGQTTALQAGFDHARGRAVVSMDGDLQNDARDIPGLLAKLEEGYDLVAGYRKDRRDALLTRRVPSRVANRLIRCLTGVPVRDVGCSLRAYRRELIGKLALYSEMHRYLPILAAATERARITEVPVRHRPRSFGSSKYGLGRTWRVLLDLVTLVMLRRFRERPFRLFVLGALAAVVSGGAFSVASMAGSAEPGAVPFVFPGSALLCFGLAGYLVMVGLLAEVVRPEGFADDRSPGDPDAP